MLRAHVIGALLLLLCGVAHTAATTEPWADFLFLPALTTDSIVTFAGPQGKLIVTIRNDGSVEFGERFTADDASREFWKYLGQSMPNKCEVAK